MGLQALSSMMPKQSDYAIKVLRDVPVFKSPQIDDAHVIATGMVYEKPRRNGKPLKFLELLKRRKTETFHVTQAKPNYKFLE